MAPTNAKITMKLILYDKVTVYVTLIGPVSASAAGLDFTANKVTVGKLPVPIPQLQQPIIQNVSKLVTDNANFKQEIQSKIKSVTIAPDNFTISK